MLRPNRTARGREIGRGWAALPVGFAFQAQVMGVADGSVNVSLARAQREVAWTRAAQLAAEDVTLAATVLRFSDAGATLSIESLAAFMPWSHWALPASKRTPALYGTELEVKFLEVNRMRGRLVVSHRRHRVEQARDQLEPGSVVKGTVTSVRETAAIVNLPGDVDGLLHVSQVSELYVKDVCEVLTAGQEVYCVVINVDAKDGSIALSTKRLESQPGEIVKNSSGVFDRVAAMRSADMSNAEPEASSVSA